MPRERRKIRLIALDLDGTLFTGFNRVSDTNADAVREAVVAGVHIVLATSRWYLLAKHTADMLGVRSPLICHNGAMIRDPIDGARLLDLEIPREPAIEIAEIADRARYETLVTVDDVTYFRTKMPQVDPQRLLTGMVVTDSVSEHVTRGAESFLFFGQDAVDGLQAALDGRYDGVLNLAAGFSETFPPYLNIVNSGADKGRALQIVCDHLGVPIEESLAIGDAAPDLDMMRAAGIGMAMGNAPEDVKAQADVVGPDNREDGVAWAIREYAL